MSAFVNETRPSDWFVLDNWIISQITGRITRAKTRQVDNQMDNRTDNCTNDRAYNKMQKIKDKSKKNLGRFKKKKNDTN